MQIKSKSLNFQIFIEVLCYLIFGGLLIYLINSGKYLTYVAPRMKPYLYFTAIIMFIWALTGLRRIFIPKYKIRSLHCFVLVFPILLLLLPHKPVNTAELSANYSSGNALIQSAVINNKSKNDKKTNMEISSEKTENSFIDNTKPKENNNNYEENIDNYEISDKNHVKDNSNYIVENNNINKNDGKYEESNNKVNNINNETLKDNSYVSNNNYNNTKQSSYEVIEEKNDNINEETLNTDDESINIQFKNSFNLSGIDVENKKIIVSNDEFYQWIIEIYTNMDKYEGYTISMTGFVFKDPQFLKEDEFVPARLSLTCCTADLAPMGMICKYDKASELEENSWVTVEGIIYIGQYEERDEPQISVTKIIPAEEVEGYIYPF